MSEEKKDKGGKDISDFMLSEYQHISTAHFETANQITSFFRYYLLIISAPTFIFILFNKEPDRLLQIISDPNASINIFIGYLLLLISFIGFLICIFIINKKINSVLYARSVNGIRKYFQEKSNNLISEYLVLPTNINFPNYFQLSFLSIIIAFAIIDTGYLFLALLILGFKSLTICLSILFILIHLSTYYFWAKYKSKKKE